MAKRPPALSVKEYVLVSPVSTSLPLTMPTTVPFAAFSATVFAERLRSVGASLMGVTLTSIVSVALENAVVPPLLAVVTLAPTAPLVWSHARTVSAAVLVPL